RHPVPVARRPGGGRRGRVRVPALPRLLPRARPARGARRRGRRLRGRGGGAGLGAAGVDRRHGGEHVRHRRARHDHRPRGLQAVARRAAQLDAHHRHSGVVLPAELRPPGVLEPSDALPAAFVLHRPAHVPGGGRDRVHYLDGRAGAHRHPGPRARPHVAGDPHAAGPRHARHVAGRRDRAHDGRRRRQGHLVHLPPRLDPRRRGRGDVGHELRQHQPAGDIRRAARHQGVRRRRDRRHRQPARRRDRRAAPGLPRELPDGALPARRLLHRHHRVQGHVRVPGDDPDPAVPALRDRRRGPLGEGVTETPHPSGARGLVLRRLLNVAAAAALLVALYLVSSYGSVKLGQVFALFAIWGIATVSLNLINGVTGILSLGHHGFMLIGGYVTGLLMLPESARANLSFSARNSLSDFAIGLSVERWMNALGLDFLAAPETIGVRFVIAALLGGLLAAVFGLVVGFPSLRLRGDYLAVVTFAFGEVIRLLASTPLMASYTNGALGFAGVPSQFGKSVWWTFGALAITVFVFSRLKKGSYGRALHGILEDEIAAEAMGVNIAYHKLLAFVISAFFAGVAGGLWVSWVGTARLDLFLFT